MTARPLDNVRAYAHNDHKVSKGEEMNDFTVSYAGHLGAWKGVIRRGNVVIWVCPHEHTNRDHSSYRDVAATACARSVLDAALHPESRWAMVAPDDPRGVDRAQYLQRVIFPLAEQLAPVIRACTT